METPPPILESPPKESAAPSLSLTSRLANVFATPAEVFDAVKVSSPAASNWVVPALLFILVSWIGAALVFSQDSIRQQLSDMTDQAIEKQIERGHMSGEQAEKARELGSKYAGLAQKAFAVIGPPFAGFASPFFWALVFWLIGGRVFKAQVDYMKAVEVAGLCNMVDVLGTAIRVLLIVVMGNLFAAPGAVLLVKEYNTQNPLHAFLGTLNIMTFWLWGVRAVGLARLSGAPVGKALAWLAGLWVLYVGWTVGMVAASAGLAHR